MFSSFKKKKVMKVMENKLIKKVEVTSKTEPKRPEAAWLIKSTDSSCSRSMGEGSPTLSKP
jgi:hypothetical protein